jgi:hypothetical protein
MGRQASVGVRAVVGIPKVKKSAQCLGSEAMFPGRHTGHQSR